MSNYRDMIPTGQGIKNFFKTLYYTFIAIPIIMILYMVITLATTTDKDRAEKAIAELEQSKTIKQGEIDFIQKQIDQIKARLANANPN